jgi:hypothetical protein
MIRFKLEKIASQPERRFHKLNNYRKLNEIGKMEDKVKSMEKVNSLIGRSLRSESSVKVPHLSEFEKNRKYYVKLVVPENEKLKAEGDKVNYPATKLQALYKEKREKEVRDLLEENIKKEDEIDDIYMTAINAKLEMLEKQHKEVKK